MSLFQELRRRKVFRVATAYAIVAWLLVQIVTAVESPLSLPEWVDTLVIVLLAVGFPIALLLAWTLQLTPTGIESEQAVESGSRPGATSVQWLTLGSQVLLMAAVGFLLLNQFVFESSSRAPGGNASGTRAQRLSVVIPEAEPIAYSWSPGASLAISPDGTQLAWLAFEPDSGPLFTHVVMRDLAETSVRRIPDTDWAVQPFFSPDGQWLAYFTNAGQLRKVSLSGGPAITIAEDARFTLWTWGAWTDAGEIVFSSLEAGVYGVPADGGPIRTIVAAESIEDELIQVTDAIAQTSYVLATRFGPSRPDDYSIEVIDTRDGSRRQLLGNAAQARLAGDSRLVFQRDSSLLTATFDAEALRIVGTPRALPDAVRGDGSEGTGPSLQFAASRNGTIAYVPTIDARTTPVIIGESGSVEPLGPPPDFYFALAVSPSGERIALNVVDRNDTSMFVYDRTRGTTRSFEPVPRLFSPSWYPDERSIIYTGGTSESAGIHRADFDGNNTLLLESQTGVMLRNTSVHPSDGTLVYTRQQGQSYEIWATSLDDPQQRRRVTAAGATATSARFSPDGRWLAWFAFEAVGPQVYVRAWPDGEPVLVAAGFNPQWSPDSAQLYFAQRTAAGDLTLFTARVGGTAAAPQIGEILPFAPLLARDDAGRMQLYDVFSDIASRHGVLPDGRVVALQISVDDLRNRDVVVVQNWFTASGQVTEMD